MKKVEWDRWRAVWGKSIKRNAVVRVRYSASIKGTQERVGRVLGATQESLIVRVFRKPLAIHYKRLRSIEPL